MSVAETWIKTTTDVNSVDWLGNPIKLKGVRALKNTKTNQIRVYPSDLSKAEIEMIAKKNGIEPRDIPLLLLLIAKPGIFDEGKVYYKYHANKLLFYLWKATEKIGLGGAFPFDDFIKADRGPMPKHIDEDLERLETKGLVKVKVHQWGQKQKEGRKEIVLTKEGEQVAHRLWRIVPAPLRDTAQRVKEDIFPMSPTTLKDRVHAEYPEYRSSYIKEDLS